MKETVSHSSIDPLLEYFERTFPLSENAIPTPEHYLPLMYTLGLKGSKDSVAFFNDKAVGGSLTMTSVKVG